VRSSPLDMIGNFKIRTHGQIYRTDAIQKSLQT